MQEFMAAMVLSIAPPQIRWNVMKGPVICLIHLCLISTSSAEVEYQFLTPTEPLAEKPWHNTLIVEGAKTPEGKPNAGAKQIHDFLRLSFEDKLQGASPQMRWEDFEAFFSWAVWGYLSPDSMHRGDERLIKMSQVWLDTLNQKAAKDEKLFLGSWKFHYYTIPLLEVDARPELKAKIGEERIEKYRALVMKSLHSNTSPEAYNDLMRRADQYINIITHPMAVYVHGWLLTGEKKYLQMSDRIVQTLARDQMPNGMFPYRIKLHGDRHLEFEAMYYHAMNNRGLYLYWWATGSKLAELIMRKSIPYYPLNLEPPYHFNGGADIWWKDQWRTFWPHHIAMVAAVTGDAENAAIANAMAPDNRSHDRNDCFLGAHAYQQMALKEIKPQPLREGYLIEDPDIRGLRLRSGKWSSTFTTGSFTYTRASAMRVADDGKSYSALHLARPYVRVAPLDKPWKTEPDFGTLGSEGATYKASPAAGEVTAVATTYSPALTSHTWQKVQPVAKWKMSEIWLMLDHGMVGLIYSEATEDNDARELCHQFRFISLPPRKSGEEWVCGDIRFKVWATDFEYTIQERMRRFALGMHDRRDWQICLSDTERSPEDKAQNPQPEVGAEGVELILPEIRNYKKGYKRFSLIEVSSKNEAGFASVKKREKGDFILVDVTSRRKSFTAVFNASNKTIPWEPRTASGLGDLSEASRKNGNLDVKLNIPPGGMMLLSVETN